MKRCFSHHGESIKNPFSVVPFQHPCYFHSIYFKVVTGMDMVATKSKQSTTQLSDKIYVDTLNCYQQYFIEPRERGEEMNYLVNPCGEFDNAIMNDLRNDMDMVYKLIKSNEEREEYLMRDIELAPCREYLLKRRGEYEEEGISSDKTDMDLMNCVVPIRCNKEWESIMRCKENKKGRLEECRDQAKGIFICALERGLLESMGELEIIYRKKD